MDIDSANQRASEASQVSGEALHSLIGTKLNTVHVKMSRQVGQAVQSAANLRLPEWRILALLATNSGMSQSDIRIQIGMDKGQISRTVKNMMASDLLSAENSSGQARNVKLSLSEKGVEVFRKVHEVMEARNQALLASLSEDDLKTLYHGLSNIEQAVDSWSPV